MSIYKGRKITFHASIHRRAWGSLIVRSKLFCKIQFMWDSSNNYRSTGRDARWSGGNAPATPTPREHPRITLCMLAKWCDFDPPI